MRRAASWKRTKSSNAAAPRSPALVRRENDSPVARTPESGERGVGCLHSRIKPRLVAGASGRIAGGISVALLNPLVGSHLVSAPCRHARYGIMAARCP